MKKLHKYRPAGTGREYSPPGKPYSRKAKGRTEACVNHAVSCTAEMDTKAQAWYDEADINQRKNSKTIV